METLKKYRKKLISKTKKLSVSPRSYTSELAYNEAKRRGTTHPLADEPTLQAWKYWRLIDNAFPYDVLFKTHHMLVPKRVVVEQDLNELERQELEAIFVELSTRYSCRLVNFPDSQSIKKHFHIHLLTFKDDRDELTLY